VKSLLLFAWNMPPRKSNQYRHPSHISGRMTRILKKHSKTMIISQLQTDSDKIHKAVMMSHNVLVFRKRGQSSGREWFIGRASTKIPHFLFLLPVARKKSPSARQWRSTRMEPLRHARTWWYHISSKVFWEIDLSPTVRGNSPAYPADELPLLFSRTRHQERGSES